MKKILITILAALCVFAAPVSSLEWGGVFKNDTELMTSDFKALPVMQSNSIYLWMNSPVNKTGTLNFTSEAMYKYKLVAADGSVDFSNIADIDLLKLSYNTDTVALNAGRFMVMDSSNAVFAQNCDGVSFKYSLQTVRFGAYAGCTALVNSNAVEMLNAEGAKFLAANDVYALSNPFIPLMVSVELPSILGNQTLSVQGNAFIDLGEEKNSRYYAELTMNGPVSNSLFYNVTTVAGTAMFKNFMNYSSLNLFFFPNANLLLNAGAEYASGESGNLSKFVGITSKTAYSSAAYPETSGVFIPKIAASIATDSLYTGFTGKFVMDCAENNFAAKGLEADVNLTFNIFSDLQVGMDITTYFGVNGDSSENNYTATLRAAISF